MVNFTRSALRSTYTTYFLAEFRRETTLTTLYTIHQELLFLRHAGCMVFQHNARRLWRKKRRRDGSLAVLPGGQPSNATGTDIAFSEQHVQTTNTKCQA